MFKSIRVRPLVVLLLWQSLSWGVTPSQIAAGRSAVCRYLPGDRSWPSDEAWAELNATVNNRLIKTTPVASVCHGSMIDEQACEAFRKGWVFPQTYFDSPSGFVAPYFQNQSCDPFTARSSPCQLGNDVVYAINVSSAQDVAYGLRFADHHNIRLVIKNTGHDLLGRSTGKGAISIWTHYLKSIDFMTFNTSEYVGPAVKLGAGVQGWGVAPDQVLEWGVVTSNGSHLVASPTANSDLFWALSGGGAGTYGVVLSLTVKAFPDALITGVALSFNSTNISQTTFWEAVTSFHATVPTWVDEGATAKYAITNETFYLEPGAFLGLTTARVTTLLQPLESKLRELGIQYALNVTTFPSYLDHFSNYFGPLPYGIWPSAQVQGGRMIPRSVILQSNERLDQALQAITAQNCVRIIGTAFNVSRGTAGRTNTTNAAQANSVLPAWRQAMLSLIAATAWDYTNTNINDNTAKEDDITDRVNPLLQSVAGPDSGVYMNEGDLRQPDFQSQFYGSNYDKLREVKDRYDPQHLFYATAAVGSEEWAVAADGRLCRSNASSV